jgi:hypothetical protein
VEAGWVAASLFFFFSESFRIASVVSREGLGFLFFSFDLKEILVLLPDASLGCSSG